MTQELSFLCVSSWEDCPIDFLINLFCNVTIKYMVCFLSPCQLLCSFFTKRITTKILVFNLPQCLCGSNALLSTQISKFCHLRRSIKWKQNKWKHHNYPGFLAGHLDRLPTASVLCFVFPLDIEVVSHGNFQVIHIDILKREIDNFWKFIPEQSILAFLPLLWPPLL